GLGVILAALAATAALALGPQPPYAPLAFADASHGWLATQRGIQGTVDGGRTWRLETRIGGDALDAVDAKHAWAIAGQGQLLHTEDGSRWRNLGVKHLQALSFVDARRGYGLE